MLIHSNGFVEIKKPGPFEVLISNSTCNGIYSLFFLHAAQAIRTADSRIRPDKCPKKVTMKSCHGADPSGISLPYMG
jgi:hypothetical protein